MTATARRRAVHVDCAEAVDLRVRYGRPTIATVEVERPEGSERVTTEIVVRDLLIVGLGDSVASGEGNPDRPIALADHGFCFRQLAGSERTEYFRPSRAGFRGDRSCDAGGARRGVESPLGTLAQFRLPPLALQLSAAHRASAGRREPADRRDVRAAGLHRERRSMPGFSTPKPRARSIAGPAAVRHRSRRSSHGCRPLLDTARKRIPRAISTSCC